MGTEQEIQMTWLAISIALLAVSLFLVVVIADSIARNVIGLVNDIRNDVKEYAELARKAINKHLEGK